MTAPTIYFVGGELEAVVDGSHAATTWTTAGGTYDSEFARGAVALTTSSNSDYIRIPLTAPQATCWVSLQAYFGSNNFLAAPVYFQAVNAAGASLVRAVRIGGTASQPFMQFQAWNGSAWTAVGTGRVVAADARHKWDVQYQAAVSGGALRCYVDGVLIGELTGVTSFISPNTLSELRVYPSGGGGVPAFVAISEVQVLDVSTLGRRLATLGETANGVNTDWTGSFSDIDETGTFNDANFIQSGTADQVSTFVTTDLSDTAQAYNVSTLVIAGRCLKGGTGPQNLKGATVIGGTTYISAANVTGPQGGLITDFAYNWAIFAQNPATAADFTPAEINTVGFETGWKSIA